MSKQQASPRNPSPLPNPHRWMLFVDGENFTAQGQELARRHGLNLRPGKYFNNRMVPMDPRTP